jgi:hypothetical protein
MRKLCLKSESVPFKPSCQRHSAALSPVQVSMVFGLREKSLTPKKEKVKKKKKDFIF